MPFGGVAFFFGGVALYKVCSTRRLMIMDDAKAPIVENWVSVTPLSLRLFTAQAMMASNFCGGAVVHRTMLLRWRSVVA